MKIGIIGGSGLEDPRLVKDATEKKVTTPYGDPSSSLTLGKIDDTDAVILSRHGRHHEVSSSDVNFRANLYALKQEQCTHIIATSAVGSLREEIRPGNFVFPDQFIDFTRSRNPTFAQEKVKHVSIPDPFDRMLRDALSETSERLSFAYNRDVTLVIIEGPRYSTRAESRMFQHWGGDIIKMATCPEVVLAHELEMNYQTVGIVADYDTWKEDTEQVSADLIKSTMDQQAERIRQLLVACVPKVAEKIGQAS